MYTQSIYCTFTKFNPEQYEVYEQLWQRLLRSPYSKYSSRKHYVIWSTENDTLTTRDEED